MYRQAHSGVRFSFPMSTLPECGAQLCSGVIVLIAHMRDVHQRETSLSSHAALCLQDTGARRGKPGHLLRVSSDLGSQET